MQKPTINAYNFWEKPADKYRISRKIISTEKNIFFIPKEHPVKNIVFPQFKKTALL